MADIVGGILAGGLGRRMGGADKALLALAGRPLIGHVIECLHPQCGSLAINANGDPARFSAFGLPVIPDDVPDRPGPLAGILALLDHAAAAGGTGVLTVAADMPFLPGDLLARLREARDREGAHIARASSGDNDHHVVALWPVALRGELQLALAGGVRRMSDVLGRHRVARVVWPTEPVDPFFNLNTPADLAAAEAILARGMPVRSRDP